MSLNRENLRSTGKVIHFTFQRLLKNKANIILSVILIVAALVSIPIVSIIMKDSSPEVIVPSDIAISGVWINNQTEYPISHNFESESPWYGVEFHIADFGAGEYDQRINRDEAFVDIYFDSAQQTYAIKVYALSETLFAPSDLVSLSYLMQDLFERSRLESHNVSDEQMAEALMGYYTNTMTEKTFLDKDGGRDTELRFVVQYVYSIAILILGLFSTAYIIRAIIEEKGSNIVELLMVSVKPLAVITGKIIAVMLYIFAFFMILIASIVISWFISSSFLDTSGISSMINDIGISSAMSLGPESAFVLLFSLLLAYLMIAIMGGISGSACSSMEDMESAQLSVVFIILVGYILSSLAPFFDSTPASVLFAIIPIISMFTAPISYVFGDISSGVLLLSWAFQTLIIIYLSLFCSRVYSELFIYKGNRIKFIELVSLSRRKKVDG